MKTVSSRLMSGLTCAAVATAALVAGAATAQNRDAFGGVDPEGGLHWHVAAPEGVSWSLQCRFRPVKIRGSLTNSYSRTGEGPLPGRLPSDNGRCSLTRVSGAGPIGFALVKNGEAKAAGTNDAATPAVVDVF